jgi:hypothetical protein
VDPREPRIPLATLRSRHWPNWQAEAPICKDLIVIIDATSLPSVRGPVNGFEPNGAKWRGKKEAPAKVDRPGLPTNGVIAGKSTTAIIVANCEVAKKKPREGSRGAE